MSRGRRVLLKPERPLREDAYAALRAARYHLQHIKFRTEERDLRSPREANLFHAHLRAFFWELVAVHDILEADRKSDTKVKGSYEAVNDSPSLERRDGEKGWPGRNAFGIKWCGRRDSNPHALAGTGT
jgi:hypothetical protein